MRKMISFKIENLPAKEREIVDRWADEQTNIQQSLANIVMHIVGYAGNVDVMDFDVQRKLHAIFTLANAPVVEQIYNTPSTHKEPAQQTAQELVQQPKQEQTEDDIYSQAADLFDEE